VIAAATRVMAETVPQDGRDDTIVAVVCQENRATENRAREPLALKYLRIAAREGVSGAC
jgi:hypothetical protein